MAGGTLVRLPNRYQKKEEAPSNDRAWAIQIIAPAARETLRFLQDLAHKLKYQDYRTLKVQVFERTRMLAVSDEFEDVSDEMRSAMLNSDRPIEYYRALPEYQAMRDHLRSLVSEIYSEHSKDGKDWLEENKGMALREMVRLLRDGADTSPGASKLMQEMVERVLPAKASRTAAEGASIRPTPEFLELLQNALDVSERARVVDKKDEKEQPTG